MKGSKNLVVVCHKNVFLVQCSDNGALHHRPLKEIIEEVLFFWSRPAQRQTNGLPLKQSCLLMHAVTDLVDQMRSFYMFLHQPPLTSVGDITVHFTVPNCPGS